MENHENLQDPNGFVDAWHLDELSREFPHNNYNNLCTALKISHNEGDNILREVQLNNERAVRRVLGIWQNNNENAASRAKLAAVLRSARSPGLIRILLNRPIPIEDSPSTRETSSPRPSTSSESSSSSDEPRQPRINQDRSTNSFTNSGTLTAKDIKIGPQTSITNVKNAPETHHHHHHASRPQIVTQRIPVPVPVSTPFPSMKRKSENWSQPGSSTKKQRTQNNQKVVSQSGPSAKPKKQKKNKAKIVPTKSKAGGETTRPAKKAKAPKKTKVATPAKIKKPKTKVVSQPGPSAKPKKRSKNPAKIVPAKSKAGGKTTHPAKKAKAQKTTHKVAKPAKIKKPKTKIKKIKKQRPAKRAKGSKKKTGRR